jgi:hypothetical protein
VYEAIASSRRNIDMAVDPSDAQPHRVDVATPEDNA